MNINILSPDGKNRTIEISEAMKQHFSIPINHANTILDQINSGMYQQWFDGRREMICLDFGANVGLVSLFMLPACKKLYSVEPTPSHYELMKELLEANNGTAEVNLSNFALTANEGEVVFATGHATENKVSSEEGYGNHKIKVTGKPLSWFVNEIGEDIDFCKVDIESGEMLALTVEELKKVHGKIKTMFVEVHPGYGGGMDGNVHELLNRFEASGYETIMSDYQTIIATPVN